MGWMCGTKPPSVKEFLDSRWGEQNVVLASALKLNEYYAAVKLPSGQVICTVYLLKFYNEGGGYSQMCRKDMDEYSGPNADNCPESILKLLSPIDTTQHGHEWAQEWRNRCWAKIAKRKAASALVSGTKVQYGGVEYVLEKKLKGGAWEVSCYRSSSYRMSRSQLLRAEVLS